MPLSRKGKTVLHAMREQYGSMDKAKQVMYASANKGTLTGIHKTKKGH